MLEIESRKKESEKADKTKSLLIFRSMYTEWSVCTHEIHTNKKKKTYPSSKQNGIEFSMKKMLRKQILCVRVDTKC